MERNSGNSIVPVPSLSTSAMIRRTSCETRAHQQQQHHQRHPAVRLRTPRLGGPRSVEGGAAAAPLSSRRNRAHESPPSARGSRSNRSCPYRTDQTPPCIHTPPLNACSHSPFPRAVRKTNSDHRHIRAAPDLLLLLLRHFDTRPSPRTSRGDLRHLRQAGRPPTSPTPPPLPPLPAWVRTAAAISKRVRSRHSARKLHYSHNHGVPKTLQFTLRYLNENVMLLIDFQQGMQ